MCLSQLNVIMEHDMNPVTTKNLIGRSCYRCDATTKSSAKLLFFFKGTETELIITFASLIHNINKNVITTK